MDDEQARVTSQAWPFGEEFAYPLNLFDHVYRDQFGTERCDRYLSSVSNHYTVIAEQGSWVSTQELAAGHLIIDLTFQTSRPLRPNDKVVGHYSLEHGPESPHFFEVFFYVVLHTMQSANAWNDAGFDRFDKSLRRFSKVGEVEIGPEGYDPPPRSHQYW